MNTQDIRTDVSASVALHVRGPVYAKISHLEDAPDKPYAVIDMGGGATSATIFPDAAALDSLIGECTRVRDEMARMGRSAGRIVRSIHDDSPCPARAIVVHDSTDPEYVWVRWDTPNGDLGPLVREARDELTPTR